MTVKIFKNTILTTFNVHFKFEQKFFKHSLVNEFNSFKTDLNIKHPDIDLNKLLNNRNELEENIKLRKTKVDLNKIYELFEQYKQTGQENIKTDLLKLTLDIPNTTHSSSPRNKDFIVKNTLNEKIVYDFKPKTFLNLTNKNNLCRTENISHYLGKRSYYFTGDLCLLEDAIIQYVINKLEKLKFEFITVSDILNESIIQRCGMNTRGNRSQVYHLEPEYYGEGWCLSGTAEMGIARYLMNKTIPREDLPLKLAAMSRCYRAEISDVGDEKGVYRVHCFTKIEMFGVTKPEESENNLQDFLNFEETIFSELGLHIRSLDMGINELGSQAHRKFDVEAWMPGGKRWGELSSCSDCTDYQVSM